MPHDDLGLDPVQETALLTLYARALDGKGPDPILGDALSAEVADQVVYDFDHLKVRPTLVAGTALRARKLDDIVRRFVTAHPDAVVLDLGCGLDTRVVRCAPPAGVDWYDVDLPVVADLRRRLLPDRSHVIGADITEPGWLQDIPGDRPAMIVAEGVLPFLPGESFATMVRGLTDHLAGGELALNGYTRFAAWSMRYHPTIRALGVEAAEGFDDPHEPERWGAGLALIEEQLLTRAPEVAAFPQPARAIARLMAHSGAASRQGARVLRYRFGADRPERQPAPGATIGP